MREEMIDYGANTESEGRRIKGADWKNNNTRFCMYQKATLLIHGILGKGNRRELPSCVVVGIKELYPQKDNNYVGFRQRPARR